MRKLLIIAIVIGLGAAIVFWMRTAAVRNESYEATFAALLKKAPPPVPLNADGKRSNVPYVFQLHRDYSRLMHRIRKDYEAKINAAKTDEERRALRIELHNLTQEYALKFDEVLRKMQ